jgi:glucan-binding YG repeat protein
MLKREVAVELMKHLVNHDWHGYSQYSRWGDGEGTCDIAIAGKVYHLEQGDRDCSSAIISAFEAAGISCGGATYTGNMRSCMVGTGNFVWHPMSSGYIAKPGDVYLNEVYHTAMCTSAVPDLLAEFCISETGGIDGAEGDQTGYESYEHAYYDRPWDGILECVNTESADAAKDKWVKDTKGWWYQYANGSYSKDQWLLLDTWYYFDSYGYALRNQWGYIKGLWYYFGDDCRMAKGWIKLDGHWYYLNPTAGAKPEGAMLTGWQKIGSYWYFLRPARDGNHPEGSAATEWIRDDLYWYFLRPARKGSKPECSMALGWEQIGGKWYYFNPDKNCQAIGSMMRCHWITNGGKRYYLKSDGVMAANEIVVIDGKEYKFDGSGEVQ